MKCGHYDHFAFAHMLPEEFALLAKDKGAAIEFTDIDEFKGTPSTHYICKLNYRGGISKQCNLKQQADQEKWSDEWTVVALLRYLQCQTFR